MINPIDRIRGRVGRIARELRAGLEYAGTGRDGLRLRAVQVGPPEERSYRVTIERAPDPPRTEVWHSASAAATRVVALDG